MGVGQRRRGGTASKKQLVGWMWKEQDGGSDVLKKDKRVGVLAEEKGVEAKWSRKEQWQWKVTKRSRSESWFPRSELNVISPRGKGGKSSPCESMLSDSCACLSGLITLTYEPVSKLVRQVEYQMWMLGTAVLKSFFLTVRLMVAILSCLMWNCEGAYWFSFF